MQKRKTRPLVRCHEHNHCSKKREKRRHTRSASEIETFDAKLTSQIRIQCVREGKLALMAWFFTSKWANVYPFTGKKNCWRRERVSLPRFAVCFDFSYQSGCKLKSNHNKARTKNAGKCTTIILLWKAACRMRDKLLAIFPNKRKHLTMPLDIFLRWNIYLVVCSVSLNCSRWFSMTAEHRT